MMIHSNCNYDALVNLAKNFHMQIKVGSQYVMIKPYLSVWVLVVNALLGQSQKVDFTAGVRTTSYVVSYF